MRRINFHLLIQEFTGWRLQDSKKAWQKFRRKILNKTFYFCHMKWRETNHFLLIYSFFLSFTGKKIIWSLTLTVYLRNKLYSVLKDMLKKNIKNFHKSLIYTMFQMVSRYTSLVEHPVLCNCLISKSWLTYTILIPAYILVFVKLLFTFCNSKRLSVELSWNFFCR